MKPQELLERIEAGKSLPGTLRLRGDDAFVEKALKDALVAQGLEVVEFDLANRGANADFEAEVLGISLLSPRRAVWCRRPAAASKWEDRAIDTWTRTVEQCDGDALVVLLSVPEDKRLKWDALGKMTEVSLALDAGARLAWVDSMNRQRGGKLGSNEIRFLAMQDADLMQIESWVELWSLGGNAWAERALGYGKGGGVADASVDQPAFFWVDCVLKGDAKGAHRGLRQLRKEGGEPIQLLALLMKSVRILASLSGGHAPSDQPEFLVNKIRPLVRIQRPGRAERLLQICAAYDRQFKSTSVNAWAALASLAQ